LNWIVTPRNDVVGCRRFGRLCCPHVQGEIIRWLESGNTYWAV